SQSLDRERHDQARAGAPGQAMNREKPGRDVVNVMTVDVEDYFHVSAFERIVSRVSWGERDTRVAANTRRLLELFARANVRGTFFVLGWVADRAPDLLREIVAAGHE